MPSTPSKHRPVTFTVTLPSRFDEALWTGHRDTTGPREKPPKDPVIPSQSTRKMKQDFAKNEKYQEKRLPNSDVTQKESNPGCHQHGLSADKDVLATLKRSSHGRVHYNRHHSLSEEDLQPTNPTLEGTRHTKTLNRVCSRSSEDGPKTKTLGYIPCTRPPKSVNDHVVLEGRPLHTPDALVSMNRSLDFMEDLEYLNDTMSMLDIERRNQRSGLCNLESEKKKQDEYFRRSGELSLASYAQWNARKKEKWEKQVKELKDRDSKKNSTIESEYLKMQQFYQKKFEESQAVIKRVEQSEKKKLEEGVARQKQTEKSWKNIQTYQLTTVELIAVAVKCVPDRSIDPEFSSLLGDIEQAEGNMTNLKSDVSKIYQSGELGPQTAAKYERDMYTVYSHVIGVIEKLNDAIKRVNAEMAANAAQSLQPKVEVAKDETVVNDTTPDPGTTSPAPKTTHPEGYVEKNIISATAFQRNQALDKQLKDMDKVLEKFVINKDPEITKMRGALKLITMTPINSISASSTEHMANKIKELSSVLSGNQTTRANKTINPGINTLTLNYCFDVAAAKFVDQACEQVAFSDNLVPAFSIAAVLTGIWQSHHRFGELFLGHLYRRCPYTIPAHWAKKEGEENVAYLRRIGYSQTGERVEEPEKFLQKMEGCVTLYAAVIQTTPPFPDQPHPHGISHGWLWLSRILNLEPIPDITATVLEAFLRVAGHALHQTYKSQFLKLLDCLYVVFLPKLEAVTDPNNRGPITRLKLFLEKVKKDKSLPIPTGRITEPICR